MVVVTSIISLRASSPSDGEDYSCTTRSWRLATVLDHITTIPTILATAFRSLIFAKLLQILAFFPSILDMLGSAQHSHINVYHGVTLQLSISTYHRQRWRIPI